MRKILIFISLLIYSASSVYADKHTISGQVVDKDRGIALTASSIFESKNSKTTTSNDFGFYSFSLPKGDVSLEINHIGYSTSHFDFTLSSDTVIIIELDRIVDFVGYNLYYKNFSSSTVPVEFTKVLPALNTVNDYSSTLRYMPGVQSESNGLYGMIVRGGSDDQNLVLFEGAPIYKSSSFFGLHSSLNSDAINSIGFYKNHMPAEYSGGGSSVIDIKAEEGDMTKTHHDVGIGLWLISYNVGGPIIKNRTSYNFAFRRSYSDLFDFPFAALFEDDKMFEGAYTVDYTVKIKHIVSPKDVLYLNFYNNRDNSYELDYTKSSDKYEDVNYTFKTLESLFYHDGNLASSLRWHRIINNNFFMNSTLAYSNNLYYLSGKAYDKTKPESYYDYDNEILNKQTINDIIGSLNFEYTSSHNHKLMFGIKYTNHNFLPFRSSFKEKISSNIYEFEHSIHKRIISDEINLYVEDDISLLNFINVNVGVHNKTLFINDKTYNFIEPRVKTNLSFAKKSGIYLSYFKTSQNMQKIKRSYYQFAIHEHWIPLTENIDPLKIDNFSAGLYFSPQKNIDISIDGYYKIFENILDFRDSSHPSKFIYGYESIVAVGDGFSYGIEFLAKYMDKNHIGWIGYTWSNSENVFNRSENILNSGNAFPANNDMRHNLNLVLIRNVYSEITVSGAWTYSSGRPRTLSYHTYEKADFGAKDEYVPYMQPKNSSRFLDYNRLDFGIGLNHKKLEFKFDLFYYFNGLNPINAHIQDSYNSGFIEMPLKYTTPFVPSFNIKMKF